MNGEDLPNSGIELMSLNSPALAGVFFLTSATCEAQAGCLYRFPNLGPPLSLSLSLPACLALSRPSPWDQPSRGALLTSTHPAPQL